MVRIGFASRYFSATHSVGLLSIRVIEALSKYNREYASTDTADVTFHVTVYFIAGVQQPEDAVQATVIEAADKIVFLPADLNTCVSVMRRANLNVLIYPEVGIDPVTYFLAYSRLAERQVAWIGIFRSLILSCDVPCECKLFFVSCRPSGDHRSGLLGLFCDQRV